MSWFDSWMNWLLCESGWLGYEWCVAEYSEWGSAAQYPEKP